MILVVGATGHVGGEICRRLRERGKAVRALVRSTTTAEQAEGLKRMGVEICVGDLTHMMSVAAACQDIDDVVNAASSVLFPKSGDTLNTVELDGALSLVEFARVLGVRRFVYVSHPRTFRTQCPLLRARSEVEFRLAHCGLQYTILRANFFMETWLSPLLGFDYSSAKATIFGDGKRPIGWVSCRDVAEIAVQALESDPAADRSFDVAGPENLPPRDVVRIFENAGGKPFAVDYVSEQALEAQYQAAADPITRSVIALKLEYARGCVIDGSDVLERIPLKLTSVRDYADRLFGKLTQASSSELRA